MTLTQLQAAHTPVTPTPVDEYGYLHFACGCGFVAPAGWAYPADVDDERRDHQLAVIGEQFYGGTT